MKTFLYILLSIVVILIVVRYVQYNNCKKTAPIGQTCKYTLFKKPVVSVIPPVAK